MLETNDIAKGADDTLCSFVLVAHIASSINSLLKVLAIY